MELPVKRVLTDDDVVTNDIIFYSKEGKYKYFQVKSLFGGTPGISYKLHQSKAVWVLIGELNSEGISLYKLVREEIKNESANHVCGLQGFMRGSNENLYNICPGCESKS
jgi:hypothetical protein